MTDIDWCDYLFSPVTGCYHDCPYCFMNGYVNRFGGSCIGENCMTAPSCRDDDECKKCPEYQQHEKLHVLEAPKYIFYPKKRVDPYPYGFESTFHKYRLGNLTKIKKPSIIGVVLTGDLFGEWVPDEWIKKVFEACKAAPQHKYLFLTKNSDRYCDLYDYADLPSNFWYGSTITKSKDNFAFDKSAKNPDNNYYLSIEPILEEVSIETYFLKRVRWVIVGAETGNRKDKVKPKPEWIISIVEQCKAAGVPIFMKNNLKQYWPGELIREWPEGLK